VLREGTGRRSQVQIAGLVARRMAQEKSIAADLAAGACWVRCMVGIPRMEVLGVVLEVGIRMAASDLHKEVAAAAAVGEADMMIGGDASGTVVGGSVAVATWKTQEAPHSLVWL
jgi:hypothetical protein